jgi:RNA polymerase sigma-70 factor (ECF subfamily)
MACRILHLKAVTQPRFPGDDLNDVDTRSPTRPSPQVPLDRWQADGSAGVADSPGVSISRNSPVPADIIIAAESGAGELTDELLVWAAKSGSATAFFELSKRYSNKLFQAAYRITRNWHDAEDAVQESLLKAFGHLKYFEGGSSFSSWLKRITINSALMTLRRRRSHSEIPIEVTDDDLRTWQRWEPQDTREDPEKRFTRCEREELLRRAILRLPPVFRHIIELQQINECSMKEIAAALGISVGAVKSRLMRARIALRASLQ